MSVSEEKVEVKDFLINLAESPIWTLNHPLNPKFRKSTPLYLQNLLSQIKKEAFLEFYASHSSSTSSFLTNWNKQKDETSKRNKDYIPTILWISQITVSIMLSIISRSRKRNYDLTPQYYIVSTIERPTKKLKNKRNPVLSKSQLITSLDKT